MYRDVLMALAGVLAGIPGIHRVLTYEPTAIHAWPTLYLLFDDAEVTRSGHVLAVRYTILARLVFRWQDNERAELQLADFVNSVIDAIDQNRQLDGHLNSGLATVKSVTGVFVQIGGVLCRALDYRIEVLEKT